MVELETALKTQGPDRPGPGPRRRPWRRFRRAPKPQLPPERRFPGSGGPRWFSAHLKRP